MGITSTAIPNVADWAFNDANDHVFDNGFPYVGENSLSRARATPREWIKRGPEMMRDAMALGSFRDA